MKKRIILFCMAQAVISSTSFAVQNEIEPSSEYQDDCCDSLEVITLTPQEAAQAFHENFSGRERLMLQEYLEDRKETHAQFRSRNR